jgi:carboxylesterase
MAYRKGPSEKDKKDPVGVLVLHGFTSHIHCVDPLLPGLDELGVPYRFPILKGHGTRPEDMENATAEDWYRDAENALLDLYQDAEKVIVMGLSMGGAMALDLAAYHRDKVAAVVTIAAAVKVADPLAPLSPVLAGLIRFWPSPNAFTDKELAKKENKNYNKFSTKSFASLYRYIKGTKNRLSFIKAPILILQSKKDTVVSPDSAKIIYEKVSSKEKQIVWFEKTNHRINKGNQV